jgi:hypothetical protein
MNWLLPSFARIKFPRLPALWLPIFLLLWPCAFLVFSLGLLLTLSIAGPRARALECLGTAWRLLCALRGTQVDVQQPYARYHFSLH